MFKLPKLSKRKKISSPTPPKPPSISSGKKRKPKTIPIMVQYIGFYKNAIAKYGERTAVLCHVGDFYECYSYDGKEGYDGKEANGKYETNIYEIADAVGVTVGKYSKTAPLSVTNPMRWGFQRPSISKWKNKLLDADFTVVMVEQTNDSTSGKPIHRELGKVFSPGVRDNPLDFNYNNVVCIVIENQNSRDVLLHRIDQYELCVGMSAIDVSTNTSTVYEISSLRDTQPELAANEIYRFLQTHNCRELVIYLENFQIKDEKEERKLKRYFNGVLELDRYNVHHFKLNTISKEFKKANYQNKLLKKVFGSELCGPGVSPIEYLELEMFGAATLSYCCLIDFIYQRNETYLNKLNKPMWWKNDTHLVLTHNAIRQLDVTRNTGSTQRGKHSSLFHIINHTVTNQGKRMLEGRLLRPFLDEKSINNSYEQIQDLYNFESLHLAQSSHQDDEPTDSPLSYMRKNLREICDFKRYHRKMELGKIYPNELYELIQSYASFIELIDWIYMQHDEYPGKINNIIKLIPDEETLLKIRKFYNEFYKVYDFEALRKNSSLRNIQENLFKKGYDEELDKVCEHLGSVENRLDKLRMRLCNIIDSASDKPGKLVTLRTTKNSGKMFRANLINSGVLKWYQKQIRNAIYASGKESEDLALQHINVTQYSTPTDLLMCKGSKIIDSDMLDWAEKKKIQFNDNNSDEESDENGDDADYEPTYMSVEDMKLVLSLNFRTNKTNVNITTNAIVIEEQSSDEYLDILLELMNPKSQQFLKKHYAEYADIISIFSKLSAEIDIVQSHTKTAIRYQYFKPSVVDRRNEKGELLPSFIDVKGFRHPIVERVQDDIEYVKNDLKLGRETVDDDNIIGMLEFAINNCGKTTCEKAIALNIILAQTGSFVAADKFRFRPFKNIITRLDGLDNMWKGQGSFAVEMSELRTVANQATQNSLVLGDEICRGTEQDSAITIMAATIEWLCLHCKANFIISSHYHEVLDFEEISSLKELGVFHLTANIHPETGAIIYEYKLSKGVGPTIFGIEVAKSMGYNSSVCDRAIYFRNKRMKKKQHYLAIKTSQYDSELYMDACSVKECKEDPCDSHHNSQQHTADEFGNISHFHKNRKHNLVPLCKKHHNLADKGLLHFEYKMTSNGVELICTSTVIDK